MIAEATCWLIRAGESSRHARRFADYDIVAIGWPTTEGLKDLTGMSAKEIRACLDRDPTIAAAAQDAAELLAFRDDLAVGDIVVTPDAQTAEVLFGEVAGGYEYRDPSPAEDFKHVRQVRWYGRIDRHLLPADLESETRWRRTIRRLKHQAEWRSMTDRVLAGEGRDATARGRPDIPGTDRSRHGPSGPPTRRCPTCGLAKVESQFVDVDDRCVDCR